MSSHIDNTLYIVGGGPSLEGFDWRLLGGKRVWAINTSVLDCPHAEIVFWVDETLFQEWGDILMSQSGKKMTARFKKRRVDYPSDVQELTISSLKGFTSVPGQVCGGNNSGYALLHYAIQIQASSCIALLGFDMDQIEGKSNYHDRNPKVVPERTYADKMLPYFKDLVEPSQERDIQIFNLSETSKITHWPKMSFKTYSNRGGVVRASFFNCS